MSTCVQKAELLSVFDDFRILVLCCQLQLLLPLHIAVPSHCTQVAPVHRQQHHRGRKCPIADVCEPLSCYHAGDPEGNQEQEIKMGS